MKMTLEITDDPRSFCLLLSVIWMKDDKIGGRKERKIESWREFAEGRMVRQRTR